MSFLIPMSTVPTSESTLEGAHADSTVKSKLKMTPRATTTEALRVRWARTEGNE